MEKSFRIEPVAPPYPPELAALLGKWMPPGAAVDPLLLFRTLARHPALSNRLRPTGAYLLNKGTLAPRDRELAILRTCARCGCEYEWGVHSRFFAAAVGLDDAAVAATVAASTSAAVPLESLAEEDAALLALVDDLHDRGTVSDAAWARCGGRFSDEQRLELLVLVGFYHLISYVANGARVALEPWATRWP